MFSAKEARELAGRVAAAVERARSPFGISDPRSEQREIESDVVSGLEVLGLSFYIAHACMCVLVHPPAHAFSVCVFFSRKAGSISWLGRSVGILLGHTDDMHIIRMHEGCKPPTEDII